MSEFTAHVKAQFQSRLEIIGEAAARAWGRIAKGEVEHLTVQGHIAVDVSRLAALRLQPKQDEYSQLSFRVGNKLKELSVKFEGYPSAIVDKMTSSTDVEITVISA